MVPITNPAVNPETQVSDPTLPYVSLQSAVDHRPNLLHATPIDTKVTIPRSGSRSKMDRLRFIIKHEFDIVHESKQQAPKFVMEVGLVLFNEFRTG